MTQVTESIARHSSLIKNTGSTIASVGLESVGKKVAGRLIAPAVWSADYAVGGKKPNVLDVGLYLLSMLNIPGLAASVGTGTIKAVVDDDVADKLEQVRNAEGSPYKDYIFACHGSGAFPPRIIAGRIASKGGTAWRHPNGLWVFIVDGRGSVVHDFEPKRWTIVYQPNNPLETTPSGGFRWGERRK